MADLFDTLNVPSGEPDIIYVGDLTRWRRSDLSDTYDPALYDLKYSARRGTANSTEVEITAGSDATGFLIDESFDATNDWPPGAYRWQAYITRKADDERILVDRGRWTFLSNLDASDNTDPRSHAEKMVNFLEAALENRAGSDIIYYMIGGRAVSKIPPGELRSLLADYRQELAGEVSAERRRRGKPNSNTINVRFGE